MPCENYCILWFFLCRLSCWIKWTNWCVKDLLPLQSQVLLEHLRASKLPEVVVDYAADTSCTLVFIAYVQYRLRGVGTLLNVFIIQAAKSHLIEDSPRRQSRDRYDVTRSVVTTFWYHIVAVHLARTTARFSIRWRHCDRVVLMLTRISFNIRLLLRRKSFGITKSHSAVGFHVPLRNACSAGVYVSIREVTWHRVFPAGCPSKW